MVRPVAVVDKATGRWVGQIGVTRADHAASRRVMEKCGLAFQEQLVHKGALVVWYAIDRADWQAGQAPASR
jgi:hypothetical protein